MHCTLRALFAVAALGLSLAAGTGANAQGAGSSVWLTQAGDARVQVGPCGAYLCGKVVWLKRPIDPQTGQPAIDDKNPNPALRNRPMIGVQLFIDMQATASNAWSGKIYNADDGKTYDSTVTAMDPQHLQVRGCFGPFCGSETWTKFSR